MRTETIGTSPTICSPSSNDEKEPRYQLAEAIARGLGETRPGPPDFGYADVWKAARKLMAIDCSQEIAFSYLRAAINGWGSAAQSKISDVDLAKIIHEAHRIPLLENEESKPGAKLDFRWFKDTTEETPDWLWNGHLLRKTTSVLGGRQGSGKGILIADIVARLSRGDSMPDGSGNCEVVKSLIVTREDDPAMALAPRLRVAKADMENVAWSTGDYGLGDDDVTRAADNMAVAAPFLEGAIVEHGFGLLIIDPLGAWIEDDGNSASQIRAVIDPMNRLARKTGCAVLFVAHLRKAVAEDPMDAFAGSHAVTAAVRTAMLVDKINGNELSLTVVKSNFRKPKAIMVWKMVDGSDTEPPSVSWRVGGELEAAMATQRQQHKAPVVDPADVLPHLAPEHRRYDDEVRRIHAAMLPTLPRVTVTSVQAAIAQLVREERAYEGRGQGGKRTLGTTPAIRVESASDRAIAAWESTPGASVREIATRVGCSIGAAHKARKLMCSLAPVHSSEIRAVNE